MIIKTQKMTERILYTQKEMNLFIDQIKAIFKNCATVGTVQEWNEIREQIKIYYPEEAISIVDVSGYINEWMKVWKILV